MLLALFIYKKSRLCFLSQMLQKLRSNLFPDHNPATTFSPLPDYHLKIMFKLNYWKVSVLLQCSPHSSSHNCSIWMLKADFSLAMPSIMLIFTLHFPNIIYISILNILFILKQQRQMPVSNNYDSEHNLNSERKQSNRIEKDNRDSYSKMPGM